MGKGWGFIHQSRRWAFSEGRTRWIVIVSPRALQIWQGGANHWAQVMEKGGTSRPFPKTLRESIFAFSTTHDASANGARAHASKCMTIRYCDTALKVSYVAEFTRSSKFIKACSYKNGRFELLREFASMEELPTVVRKGMRKALLHIRLTTLQRATID